MKNDGHTRSYSVLQNHFDVIKWKHFPRYWPFVCGIHRSPVNSPHKGQWRGPLMFSFNCAWTNNWANNGNIGELRQHRAHNDVITLISKEYVDKNECYELMGLCEISVWEGFWMNHFDGLVQDCSNLSALAMELLQSCPEPSICIAMGLRFQTSFLACIYYFMFICGFFTTVTQWWTRWRLNHRRLDCLLNRLFRRRSKKTSKLRHWLCDGNSPVTGEFPAQRASNEEIFPFDDVIMSWTDK